MVANQVAFLGLQLGEVALELLQILEFCLEVSADLGDLSVQLFDIDPSALLLFLKMADRLSVLLLLLQKTLFPGL